MIVPLSSSCFHWRSGSKPEPPKSVVVQVIENHKYKLEAVFSGYDLQMGDQTVKVIDALSVRSKVSGQEVKYAPAHGPSESDAHAYFTAVWSPDEEFLALPRNRFLGFCIVRAADALSNLQKQSCSDFVSVRMSTPIKETFWHEFEKWDGDESFVFKAGLYGDNTRLKYEITSGRLTALDSNLPNIEGVSGKGKLPIDRSH